MDRMRIAFMFVAIFSYFGGLVVGYALWGRR